MIESHYDRWLEAMTEANKVKNFGAPAQMVIIMGNIARSLAVIADHLDAQQ